MSWMNLLVFLSQGIQFFFSGTRDGNTKAGTGGREKTKRGAGKTSTGGDEQTAETYRPWGETAGETEGTGEEDGPGGNIIKKKKTIPQVNYLSDCAKIIF